MNAKIAFAVEAVCIYIGTVGLLYAILDQSLADTAASVALGQIIYYIGLFSGVSRARKAYRAHNAAAAK